jgi:hypothetical protein
VQDKLDAILNQTTLTNGRLRTAERAITALQVGYFLGAFVCGTVFAWALNTWGPGK